MVRAASRVAVDTIASVGSGRGAMQAPKVALAGIRTSSKIPNTSLGGTEITTRGTTRTRIRTRVADRMVPQARSSLTPAVRASPRVGADQDKISTATTKLSSIQTSE